MGDIDIEHLDDIEELAEEAMSKIKTKTLDEYSELSNATCFYVDLVCRSRNLVCWDIADIAKLYDWDDDELDHYLEYLKIRGYISWDADKYDWVINPSKITDLLSKERLEYESSG